MSAIDAVARRIINDLQIGFPLSEQPFAEVAGWLGLDEATVIQQVESLLAAGFLSRFGPLFNAEQLGGGLTLAAMALPEPVFETVAATVNAFPEVAHNYAREHLLNMWFVLATERADEMEAVIARIEKNTGYPVFNLPKLAEYHLGFKLQLGPAGEVDTVPIETHGAENDATRCAAWSLEPSAEERAVIAATQEGLPLCPRPYHAVAELVGMTADQVIAHLATMLERRWIRRIGVVPNHYRLGLKGNGMSVWDLPDEKVSLLGERIASLGFVSHCYRRPRRLPEWPFNLFAMVHGADRAVVDQRVAIIADLLGAENRGHMVLYSSRILKKSGLRLKNGVGHG
ncbi:MAG: Lrp/AsnC family transcriptional regulator [Magnetococcales bacterium]|nr:Lrp/AsnC family transcriptional regulator [Magnetococcales bacterium]